MANRIGFFMGANTPKGFVSFFDELYDPFSNERCYILKGGPGTGKSTFMKKVASAVHSRGYEVEYIYCASDPDSLDAIRIPGKGISLVDGTAPHVIEPKFPGAVERLIDLGAYWDERKLHSKVNEIRSLTLEISTLHKRSIRFINAAGVLRNDTQRICLELMDETKISSFAVRLAHREINPVKGRIGHVERRFFSAVTPLGVYSHKDTVRTLCSRVIGIEDEYAAAGGLLLERVKNEALNMGKDVISCPCPMEPDGYPEHIFIPDDSLALISLRQAHKLDIKPDRIIHVSRFFQPGALSEIRYRNAFNKAAASELTMEAGRTLALAKAAHDKLEGYYMGAMNFKAADRRCEETVKLILE